MCRWGCAGLNSTFMCKWCGTRYCRECLKGEYTGLMFDESKCRKCNQKICQGEKVEFVINQPDTDDPKSKNGGKADARSRSRSPAKGRGKSSKNTSSKGGKKSGKKSGKKKGGRKKKK